MIRCACPSCQAVLNCSPSTAGAVVHCPRCGNGVQVPKAAGRKTKGVFKSRTEVATGGAGQRRQSPAPAAPAPWTPFDDLLRRMSTLSEQFRELQEGVQKAIRIASEDPEMALTRARKVLEYVIRDVYERRCKEPPGTRPLENLLQRLVKDGYLPDRLDAYATGIRKLGNVGTHTFGERITASDVYQSLGQLIPILEWYFEVERPDALPAAAPQPQPQPAVAPPPPPAAQPAPPAIPPALQQPPPPAALRSHVPASPVPKVKPPAPPERRMVVWPAAAAAVLLLLGAAGGLVWYVAHLRPQDTTQSAAATTQASEKSPVPPRPEPVPPQPGAVPPQPEPVTDGPGRLTAETPRPLLACLAQLYAQSKFADLCAARAVFRNTGNEPVRAYSVRFSLDEYAPEWSDSGSYPSVAPDQEVVTPYFPKLDLEKVVALTSDCQVRLEVEYQYTRPDGQVVGPLKQTKMIQLLGRNKVSFSTPAPEAGQHALDVRPLVLAAMVEGDDPVVQELAAQVQRMFGAAKPGEDPADTLTFLRGLYNVMRPCISNKPAAANVAEGLAPQTIRYGRDVLQDRGGTSIDLSILYASVCRAVGLKPMLVLSPDHCFPVIPLPKPLELKVKGRKDADTAETFTRVVVETAGIPKVGFDEAARLLTENDWEEAKKAKALTVDVCAEEAQGVRGLPLPRRGLKDLGFDDDTLDGLGLIGRWHSPLPGKAAKYDWDFTLNANGRYSSKRAQPNVAPVVASGRYTVGGGQITTTTDQNETSTCKYVLKDGILTATFADGTPFYFGRHPD